MKIIITSPSLDPNQNVSGISSVVQFIIDHNQGHQYSHFKLGKKDNEIRNIKWFIQILRAYINWIQLIIKSKDGLIHFNLALNELSILRDIPLIQLARIFNRKTVVHIHGGRLLMQEDSPWIFRMILRYSISSKTPVIVLSSLEKETLIKKIGTKRIFVLPNCIDLREARKFKRNYKENDILRILFLGRISVNKGLEFIYKALTALRKQGCRFKFIVAGAGSEATDYIQKFNILLGQDFEFKGVVLGDQKMELLKNCNVYILPSFHEGLPMSLIEGMAFGLIPVTTNAGSIKYLVIDGETGILVRKRSSEDIIFAIRKLSEEPELREMLSKNAIKQIFRTNDASRYIDDLNRIYQICIDKTII
ncbi:MAG: glycosyltransferase family 4 protein [Bacteroidales bacterium]|jgi:glycosyltransferase involved in cell wall biosynthesis|nr:glycosyltransferase family 4 protein [Bacteroidales bacterium]